MQDIRTRLHPRPDGSYLLDGVKHYSTGALFADWIPVLARADDDTLHVALRAARRPRPHGRSTTGTALGQRTTASGTVRLEGVTGPGRPGRAPPPHLRGTPTPRSGSPVAARRHRCRHRLAERSRRRRSSSARRAGPGSRAASKTAAEDPLLIQRFGELALQVRASEALLREAARAVDAARADLTDDSAAEASIAVAAAKVTRGGRPSRSAAPSSRWPAPARRSTPWICTGTGVTPAPTPCTTRPAGRSSTSAATCSTAPGRPGTACSDHRPPHDRRPHVSLTFHWFLPTNGDSRHVVGGGHGTPPPRPDGTGRRRSPTSARSPARPRTWASSGRSRPPAPGARTRG